MYVSTAADVGRPNILNWLLCMLAVVVLGVFLPPADALGSERLNADEEVHLERLWQTGGSHRVPLEDRHRAPDPGADVLQEGAGLDELIRRALEHNPEVGVAYHRWRASIARVPQARSLPDPQLGLGFIFDEVDRNTEYMGERYSISQMFPWFGKLGLQGDIAMQEAEAEARRYEAARLAVVAEVTAAWFEYAWLREAAATARQNLDLMMRLESVARAMYRAGEASLSDVSRAQVELGRLDDQLSSFTDMLGPAAAALNAALGRPAHAPLPVPAAPSQEGVPPLPAGDDEAWLASARERNPGLAATRHAIEREQQEVALARREYFPDVMLGLEYERATGGRIAMMDGGGRDMLVGMISVNVPIRRGRRDAMVNEARARLAATGREAHAQEAALETELKTALFSWRDGVRRLQLYGSTLLPQARQSLATTETAYRAGDAGFSDLIDAQRVLLEFQLAHERAAADRAIARARILALAGEPIEEQTP
jgi:outer membrane protein, heavy metal efflux system